MEETFLGEVCELLSECTIGTSSKEERLHCLNELERLSNKGLIRDIDFSSEEFCEAFHSFIVFNWCEPADENEPVGKTGKKNPSEYQEREEDEYSTKLAQFIGSVFSFPEVDIDVESRICSYALAEACLKRCEIAHYKSEESLIIDLVHKCYAHGNRETRAAIRQLLGSYILSGADLVSSSKGQSMSICVSLQVTGTIVKGFRTPLSKANVSLLLELLMPLHSIPGKVSHQSPTLSLIHEPLVYCVCAFVNKEERLLLDVLSGILKYWPSSWAGNTPKEVLLLHEIESLLESDNNKILLQPGSKFILNMLLGRLATSLASDHSVVCERSLLLWQNEKVSSILLECSEELIPQISRPLLTSAIVHWNVTVVKMAVRVLQIYFEDQRFSDMLVMNAHKVWEETPPASEKDQELSFESTRIRLQNLIDKQKQDEAESNDADAASPKNKIETSVPEKQFDAGLMNMVFGHELGTGSFGKVFYALKVAPNKPRSKWLEYAVKQIPKEHIDVAKREAAMMDVVSHPNCTRLIALYETSRHINLVLEYAEKGDLHTILSKLGSLDVDSTRFVAAEVAAGIGAIHKANLIFGDLKPENVLIHSNGHAKLGDFGATRYVSQMGKGAPMEGTLIYMAPELAKGKAGTSAVDWWAYGCLLYQMLSGRPPLWIADEQKLAERLVNFKIERFPSEFPQHASDLVLKLLHIDPQIRLASGQKDYKEIEQADFFREKGYNFDNMHSLKAPVFATGKVRVVQGPWNQRTYSMIFTPLPEKYSFESSQFATSIIPESESEVSLPWNPGSKFRSVISTGGSTVLTKSRPHKPKRLGNITEQNIPVNNKNHHPPAVTPQALSGGKKTMQSVAPQGLPLGGRKNVQTVAPWKKAAPPQSVAHATASYLLAKNGGGAASFQAQGIRPVRPLIKKPAGRNRQVKDDDKS